MTDAPIRPLTDQQERVARLLAAGKSYRQIALELSVTKKTVKNHVQAIAMLLPNPDGLPALRRVLVWLHNAKAA